MINEYTIKNKGTKFRKLTHKLSILKKKRFYLKEDLDFSTNKRKIKERLNVITEEIDSIKKELSDVYSSKW